MSIVLDSSKRQMNALDIFTALVDEEKILTSKGQIRFNLCDIEMTVKNKDIVGGAIESWVREWMVKKNIVFDVNTLTQTKPDVYLNPSDHKKDLLEIKAFNRDRGPAFDLADFKGFAQEMVEKPYLLDLDCLVFGYTMNETTGVIKVRNVWLKKIWQLAGSSGIWPLKVQGSQDRSIIKKVRPVVWYAERSAYRPFMSKFDFLSAYEQTYYDYQATRASASMWKFQLSQSYKKYYGKELIIPRWEEIKHNYQP